MGKYYIGLDGGSTYLKAALIGNNQVIDTMVRNTHGFVASSERGPTLSIVVSSI